jgi:hypothetical protein
MAAADPAWLSAPWRLDEAIRTIMPSKKRNLDQVAARIVEAVPDADGGQFASPGFCLANNQLTPQPSTIPRHAQMTETSALSQWETG